MVQVNLVPRGFCLFDIRTVARNLLFFATILISKRQKPLGRRVGKDKIYCQRKLILQQLIHEDGTHSINLSYFLKSYTFPYLQSLKFGKNPWKFGGKIRDYNQTLLLILNTLTLILNLKYLDMVDNTC